jgi:PAS domain S-box-containing protein
MMKNKRTNHARVADKKIFLVGIGLGALYWILESAMHAVLFHRGGLVERILTPGPSVIGMRLLVVGLLVMLAVYAQFIITERKRAEKALRESEATARALLDAPTDFVFLIDARGTILALNETAVQRFGKPSDELIGLCAYDLFPPAVAERRKAQADKVFRSGTPNRFEDERAGIWFDNVVYPVFDVRGEVTKVAVVARDITERKRAEEALRESEERFRQLAENIQDAFWVGGPGIGDQRQVLYVSPVFEKIFGIKPEEVYKSDRAWLDVVHEEDRDRVLSSLEGWLQDQGDYDVEYRIVRPDGSIRWIKARGFAIRDEEDEIYRAVGVAQDITERKRAEEALRQEKEFNENIVQTANAVIVTLDVNANITEFNNYAERLTGYSREEVIGQNWIDLFIPSEDREYIPQVFQKVYHGKELFWGHENPIVCKDGSLKLISWQNSLLKDDEGRTIAVLSIGVDITERKRAEEALRDSQRMLQTVLDSIPATVFWKDRDSIYLGANRALLEAAGLKSSEEIVGKSDYDLPWGKKQADSFREDDRRVMESGILEYDIIEPYLRADGTRAWAKTNKVPLRNTEGNVVGVFGTSEDITERKRAEEALKLRAEQLAALSQASQVVTASLELDQVLAEIVSLAGRVVASDYTSVVLVDEAGNIGRSAENLPGVPGIDYRIRDKGLTRWIVGSRQAAIIDEIGGDGAMLPDLGEGAPRFINPPIVEAGVKSVAGLPLMVKDRLLGVLYLHSPHAGAFHGQLPLLTTFANQVAIALENARLFEEVQAAREQLRDLADYLQAAREEERTHIAREIHDEFGQALSALNMDLSWLSKRLPADQRHLAEKASAMSDLIDSTIQTVRRVATELRPGLLDDLGLAAAMEWQAEEFTERTGIDCDLYLSNEEIVLERDLATAIFRIFQETLTNVARHAEATEVHVELEDRPDELVLIVRDNGKGITESQVSHPRSLGLMGMRERARSWGGEVVFQGVAGQGTTVTVRVPRPNIA